MWCSARSLSEAAGVLLCVFVQTWTRWHFISDALKSQHWASVSAHTNSEAMCYVWALRKLSSSSWIKSGFLVTPSLSDLISWPPEDHSSPVCACWTRDLWRDGACHMTVAEEPHLNPKSILFSLDVFSTLGPPYLPTDLQLISDYQQLITDHFTWILFAGWIHLNFQ